MGLLDSNYSVANIVGTIQSREKLKTDRFYRSDLSASILLMDLELLLSKITLTDKQMFILEKYWVEGRTQEEVADLLNVSQQMVEKHARAIKKKIEVVLLEWGEIEESI